MQFLHEKNKFLNKILTLPSCLLCTNSEQELYAFNKKQTYINGFDIINHIYNNDVF